MSGIKENKQYGDETALKRLGNPGTKQANGQLVPEVARQAGRPAGPHYRGAPQAVQAEPEAPSPYEEYYHNFGRAARAAQVAQRLAADPMAGPWLRRYSTLALKNAELRAAEVRDNTPYFEE